MAQAYDLPASLKICDSLPTATGQDGCWQGLFMENVNAGMRGEARKGVFSENDPLAPCDSVEDKYRHECYINLAGWLMRSFGNDVKLASAACLKAAGYINTCLQSIGLMITNPVWQDTLARNGSIGKKFEDVAWFLCRQFPSGYEEQCVLGAVDNLLNFDQTNITRAKTFCDTIDPRYRKNCYRNIGLRLKDQVTNNSIIYAVCGSADDSFKKECLAGAGL